MLYYTYIYLSISFYPSNTGIWSIEFFPANLSSFEILIYGFCTFFLIFFGFDRTLDVNTRTRTNARSLLGIRLLCCTIGSSKLVETKSSVIVERRKNTRKNRTVTMRAIRPIRNRIPIRKVMHPRIRSARTTAAASGRRSPRRRKRYAHSTLLRISTISYVVLCKFDTIIIYISTNSNPLCAFPHHNITHPFSPRPECE